MKNGLPGTAEPGLQKRKGKWPHCKALGPHKSLPQEESLLVISESFTNSFTTPANSKKRIKFDHLLGQGQEWPRELITIGQGSREGILPPTPPATLPVTNNCHMACIPSPTGPSLSLLPANLSFYPIRLSKWWVWCLVFAGLSLNFICTPVTLLFIHRTIAHYYGLNVTPPKKDMLESYPPVSQNVALFGGRAFTEIIKVKWGNEGGP